MPGQRAMASGAVGIGPHVSDALAGGQHRIVAAGAARADCHDVLVIKPRRQPGHGGMAVLAALIAGDVGSTLADGGDAVMAPDAIADDSSVRKRCAGTR